MKKLLAVILSLSILLCGCEVSKDDRIQGYPKIEYQNSQWEYDYQNMYIPVPDGYILNQGNAYEVVETNDGYNIILHFIKEG